MTTANCGSLHISVAQAKAAVVGIHSVAERLELPQLHSKCAVSRTLNRRGLSSVDRSGLKPGFLCPKTDEGRNYCKVSPGRLGFARATAVNESTIAPSAPPAPPPLQQETDIRVSKLAEDVITFRGHCTSRLKFEIEYGMKHGTTENSYLIKAEAGYVLIDLPDQTFSQAFAKVLADTIDLKSLKYLVLGHLSPKRVESLTVLLEALPAQASELQIYCSNPASLLLNKTYAESPPPKPISVMAVRVGDRLDLGRGHDLRFFLTPTPRWPDAMCTYDSATQLLFTQKIFSAHVSGSSTFDVGGWDVYGEDWRYYYDCMLAPTPTQTKAALDRLQVVQRYAKPSYKGKTGLEVLKADMIYIASSVLGALNLPVSKSPLLKNFGAEKGAVVTAAICPLHGPIVRTSLTELVREYDEWTRDKVKQSSDSTVAVIYASAYGMTATLAQAISRGISKAGVGVEMINVEISSTEELIALLQRCNGFVIGSPTLAGHLPTPVQNALGIILNDDNAKSKPCGVFGSFGWSGEAIDILETRLKDTGFTLAFPSIRSKFKATEATLQTCEESGTDLAQAVKKAKLKERKQSSPKFTVATDTEQAAGRVVGSLCVLSAKSGDAESAMLASWVSQASFVPPGLTVAVAKERAVEGLVLPGGKFVLNVLGQNKSGPIVKQLLKPFKPGETRFEGLETTTAENGGVILKDGIAWMECTVQSRLETGDHWVLYATVDSGAVLDDKAVSAIHYRKTGVQY
ncbi:unnamed protein product [Calypogeia fissa]